MAIETGLDNRPKCWWCAGDELYEGYHDNEWGVPIRDDQKMFALLMLEGFQAGLSWITILRKRDSFAEAFDNWDPETIASYGPEKIASLLENPGIIRNKLKVNGAVKNANAFLRVQEQEGSFSDYLWKFVGGEPIVNRPSSREDVMPTSSESDALSKDLKKRGFTFVGTTICYAHMQSCGMVDDHVAGCWRATN